MKHQLKQRFSLIEKIILQKRTALEEVSAKFLFYYLLAKFYFPFWPFCSAVAILLLFCLYRKDNEIAVHNQKMTESQKLGTFFFGLKKIKKFKIQNLKI